MIHFSKYSGCGNDFILFDYRGFNFPFSVSDIQQLCCRKNGIGADGVIFVEESSQADVRMRIFNSDGSEAEMCGNGLRCLAKFVNDLCPAQKMFTVETLRGKLKVEVRQHSVIAQMPEVQEIQWNLALIPETFSNETGQDIETDSLRMYEKSELTGISHRISNEDGRDDRPGSLTITRDLYPKDKARVIGSEDGHSSRSYSPRVCEKSGLIHIHALDTGVPHAVLFVSDIASQNVTDVGRKIRFHPFFSPKGTNVNFVQVLSKESIGIRTYERGVEGETDACGTGATAGALACAYEFDLKSPITVYPRSREKLMISFKQSDTGFSKIFMEGPVTHLFTRIFHTLPTNVNDVLYHLHSQ